MKPLEEPDFGRIERVLRNERTVGRVPLFEIGVDREIMEAVLGRASPPSDQERWDEYHAFLRDFYLGLGYDYANMGVRCHQEDPHLVSKTAEDTAILSRGVRSWAPMDGVVKTREDYDSFPWADPRLPDTSQVEALAKMLPDGMKVIAVSLCVMEPLAERIMGVKALSKALFRDPDLVRDVCARLGEPAVAASGAAARIREVGAVCVCDDLGYQNGTLLSPKHLREYVLPWHRKLVEAVHKAGKPAILHSCGNLKDVMDDIIDYCGYDAKHSFKDSHTPVTYAKERWGDRIALLGGIDMDVLARRTTGEVRAYVRMILEKCAERGFALGAGNSVANYIPVQNFLAMVEEGRKHVVR
jgi:uroporphyrinogen decarboxylase